MKFSFQSDQDCLGDWWGRLLRKFSNGGFTNVTPERVKAKCHPRGGWHALHVSWEGIAETQGCMHALEPSPVSYPSRMAPRHLDGVSWRRAVLRSPPQPVPLFPLQFPCPPMQMCFHAFNLLTDKKKHECM